MIRLAITHEDYAATVNLGTQINKETHIVEIENKRLEYLLKPRKYTTISISVVREETYED